MYRWLLLLLCIAAALPSQAQESRDLDEIYQKPNGPTWGEFFQRVFTGSEFGKSYALVVGISDYAYWPYIDASFVDAKRVRDFLIQDAGFDYVYTLTNAKATRTRIDKLMQEFFPRQLGKKDRFLFYFSGHGSQRATRRGIIGYLPLGTAEREGYANMISMDDVDRWSRLLDHVRQTLFVLDACFSGLAGVQRKGPLTDKTLEGLSQYGHHLITAGMANEESVASVKLWGGSLFTDAFLRGASGRADASTPEYPADGVVSLKELLEYIKHLINFESQKNRIRMSPQISDLDADNAGEFFFLAKSFQGGAVGDRQTETRISETALPKGATPDAAPTPPPAPVEPTPSEIARAQVLLAELGYNPGPADGSLGRRTQAAVEAYQRRTGLPVDGAITPGLMASLFRVAPAPPLAQPAQPTVGVPAYKAFEGFKECDVCPRMVALPGSTFTMGSPANEESREDDEWPQREVTIKPFAIGKYEVMFAEWDACVAAGGCNGYRPSDHGWGRDSRPVINVSWQDAQAYVSWLSKQTAEPYRLPTEAEWEYAARAGTTTPFSFGATISTGQANYNGLSTYGGGSKGKYRKQTVPVGSLPANPWGLYEVHGNVEEWVEDCWHESYQGAPQDGRAWSEACPDRVARGGSCFNNPRYLRSADRNMFVPDTRVINLGFRVARTLAP